MSVFKSIKGTFAAGIKSITSRDAVKPDFPVGLSRSTVNFDTGADLLARYQDVWKELHDNYQENARKAENVDGQITELYVRYDKQQEVMSRLHESVVALPMLVTQLEQATDLLASLDGEYEKVNNALVHLEDVIEEQELFTAQVIDTKKLSEYNQRKQDELENCKVQLARDHARKIHDLEKNKKNIQKEREEAFQDAFEDDLDYYKKYGRLVDKVSVSSSEGSKKMDIADVSFEEEDDALDEFLGSTDVTPLNENLPESCEETENLFSEDDYVPKIDDESDLVKSGETNTSDSDADNKHISNIQQQNSIQTWINNSNNGGEGNDKKKESNNADDEKKEPEKVSDKKTEQNKENS